MPFINSDDLEKRRLSPSNLARKLDGIKNGELASSSLVHHKTGTKREGDNVIPLPIKRTLAVLANEGSDSQKSIADTFGVSAASVSYFKRGNSDSDFHKNKDLAPTIEKIEKRRSDGESKAIDIVLETLNLIPDKLEGANLRTLVATSKTMAEVADKLAGKESGDSARLVLHLHGPEQKDIKSYPVIDITPLEGN